MASFRIQSIATVLAGACLFVSGQATAATITTTNANTWKTSTYITGNDSVVNFYPVAQTFYNTAAGISLSPSGSSTAFTFTGLNSGTYYLAGDSANKALLDSPNAGAYLNIAFPTAGENAFLVGTTASASNPLALALSDGETFSVTSGAFGLSVSHPITWLTLSAAAGSQAAVTDFWFGMSSLPQDAPTGSNPTPAPTPEPATILMTCAGGLLLVFGSRKWKLNAEQIS